MTEHELSFALLLWSADRFSAGSVHGAGPGPAAAAAAAADHVPRRDQLRRGRCARARCARQVRDRPEAGRLPGLRRSASRRRSRRSRSSTFRSSAQQRPLFASKPDRAGCAQQPAGRRRPHLPARARRPAHHRAALAAHQGSRPGMFIERYIGANDTRRGRLHRRPHRREPGLHQQPAAVAAGGRQVHGQEAPVVDAEQDRRREPARRHGPRERSGAATSTTTSAASRRATRSTPSSNLSQYLGNIRGRRKALVMFSEGIDYDIYDICRSTTADATEAIGDGRDARHAGRGDARQRRDLRRRPARARRVIATS